MFHQEASVETIKMEMGKVSNDFEEITTSTQYQCWKQSFQKHYELVCGRIKMINKCKRASCISSQSKSSSELPANQEKMKRIHGQIQLVNQNVMDLNENKPSKMMKRTKQIKKTETSKRLEMSM